VEVIKLIEAMKRDNGRCGPCSYTYVVRVLYTGAAVCEANSDLPQHLKDLKEFNVAGNGSVLVL
jgi:hypothetical protein